MKKKPKTFLIKVPLWCTGFVVHCGTDYDRFRRDVARRLELDVARIEPAVCNEVQARFVSFNDRKDAALWFRDPCPGGGVVAHEMIHAGWHIMQRSGVGFGDDSEETFAYTVGHLVQQFGQKVW